MSSVVLCLTVQQPGGDGLVETVTAVAAVAAGDLIVRPLQGQIGGRALLKLPLQDPTHHVAPLTGCTCTRDKAKVRVGDY